MSNGGEEWLLAPVGRGYYSLPDLESGHVTLWHVALANDHIAVTAENQRRAAAKK